MANEKLIETIKKLLALGGNNPNEAERNAAIAKARELMLRHNISMSNINSSDLKDYLNKDMETNTITGAQYIRIILHRFFFVECIIYAGRTAWTIVGSKVNVEIAEYMFFHIKDKFNAAWREYKKTGNEILLHSKRDFYTGLFQGLCEKLESEKQRLQQEEGLVWVGDPNIKRFKQEKWGNSLRDGSGPSTPSSGDHSAKSSGHRAGRNMQLNHGISHGAQKQNLLGGKW